MRKYYLSRLVIAASLTSLGMVGTMTSAGASPGGGRIAYSSLVPLTTPNVASLGPEAYSFSQLGNEVTVGSDFHGQAITTATLQMSSWACQSGGWTASTGPCVTTPGATFSWPITLNIYNPPAPGSDTPGPLIDTVTQTFAIPYRPSSTPALCGGDLGAWQASDGNCYHGILSTVVFHLNGVKVPGTFVYGISYNTSNHGPNPVGTAPCQSTSAGCPYDSLNIALSNDNPGASGNDPNAGGNNVTVGTDTNPGTLWWDTTVGSFYCDGGTAGTGTFRLDSPDNACWGENSPYTSSPFYVPAIQFMTGSF